MPISQAATTISAQTIQRKLPDRMWISETLYQRRSQVQQTIAPISASVVAIFKPLNINGNAAGRRSLNKVGQ
jgi:hypothetical protein